MERRLTVILATDVAGYSRLMGRDEEGTLAALGACRAIIDERVAVHRGRIFGGAGDSLIAEFGSAIEAVRCAAGIQEALRLRNEGLPRDSRMEFRIGINLGDVMVQQGDLYGEGVNIAARLEALAEPGGICLSGDVHRQIDGKTELRFEDLGPQRLKNIAKPVQVFRVADAAAGSPPHAPGARPPEAAAAGQGKPVIAVLPFANNSDDAKQDYFADGICEDIVTGLSRNPDINVISRGSTLVYRERRAGARQVGQELGAQFLLEGSIRKLDAHLIVTAQLVDAASGSPVWGERFDRQPDDVLAIQEEIVKAILHALGAADGVLERSVRERRRLSRDELTAYDCYLQARALFYRHGDRGFDEAERLFEHAIALDESFARAHSALAWLHFVRFKLFRTRSFDSIRSRARELALQALQLDQDDFRAHWVLGGLYLHEGKHARSLAAFDRALRSNPNDANLLIWSSEALTYAGRMEDALERCRLAFRLNPRAPDWYFWMMGFALFHLGRYDDAAAALERMSAPEYAGKLLAAAYAHLGRIDEARAEAAEFMKLVPDYTIAVWAKTEFYVDRNELARFVEGQRKAGLPD